MFPIRRATVSRIGAIAILCGVTMPALAEGKSLSPASAERAVVIIDDALELEAVLSTEHVAPSRRGIFKERRNDSHLRAKIDKQTGQASFEVRQTFNYEGRFRDYDQVNYETAHAPGVAGLRRIDGNREHCEAFDSGTACFEEVAFPVTEAELRTVLTSGGKAADPLAWELKYKAANGKDHRAKVPLAEVDGLLRAVDGYRQRQELPNGAANAVAASGPSSLAQAQ